MHYGVYAVGHRLVPIRGRWLAAVLTFEAGAVLSHRSAGALWGLMRTGRGPIEITFRRTRQRPGILIHRGRVHSHDRTAVDRIPATTVARTLFDLAEVVDEERLGKAAEEADRLHLLQIAELEAVCARCPGRRALAPIRRLIEEVRVPETTRSRLEDRILTLCREHDLPMPATNVDVLGHEADAFWPRERLIVEADSVAFHSHRAAFERDRERDAARQVEGYRVIRLTHRRLEREPTKVADELRRLLDSGRRDGRAGGR